MNQFGRQLRIYLPVGLFAAIALILGVCTVTIALTGGLWPSSH
jgi:hypothetical protein